MLHASPRGICLSPRSRRPRTSVRRQGPIQRGAARDLPVATREEVADLTGHDAAREQRKADAESAPGRLPADVEGADTEGHGKEAVDDDRAGSCEEPLEGWAGGERARHDGNRNETEDARPHADTRARAERSADGAHLRARPAQTRGKATRLGGCVRAAEGRPSARRRDGLAAGSTGRCLGRRAAAPSPPYRSGSDQPPRQRPGDFERRTLSELTIGVVLDLVGREHPP